MNLTNLLNENPVIAAVRNDQDLEVALSSSSKLVFVLYGNIGSIKGICSKLKKSGKLFFIHIDMLDGLKGDFAGVEFLKDLVEPCGVISTKGSIIKHAKQLGLFAIQRVFVIDSLSLSTGVKNIMDCSPSAVEILPGIADKIIKFMSREIRVPIIAGGLIKDRKDAESALCAGSIAISTSSKKLWNE